MVEISRILVKEHFQKWANKNKTMIFKVLCIYYSFTFWQSMLRIEYVIQPFCSMLQQLSLKKKK